MTSPPLWTHLDPQCDQEWSELHSRQVFLFFEALFTNVANTQKPACNVVMILSHLAWMKGFGVMGKGQEIHPTHSSNQSLRSLSHADKTGSGLYDTW